MSRKKKKEKDQLTPYSSDKISHIKPGVKIGFLRFWIIGAAYLLTFMTPAFVSEDGSTEIIAFFLVFLLLTEYVGNKIIIWMNNDNQHTLKYLPFYYKPGTAKMFWMTGVYVLIMGSATLLTLWGYNSFMVAVGLGNFTFGAILGGQPTGLEPFSVGFTYVLLDMVYFQIKWRIAKIYHARYERLIDKILNYQVEIALAQKALQTESNSKQIEKLNNKITNLTNKINQAYQNPCNVSKPMSQLTKILAQYENKLQKITDKINAFDPKNLDEKNKTKLNRLKNRQTNCKIKIRNHKEAIRDLEKLIKDKQEYVRQKTNFSLDEQVKNPTIYNDVS